MGTRSGDAAFTGGVPELYERLFVPLLFAPYAADLARRVAALRPRAVLETACGTGVVTRVLTAALPAGTEVVATDLNQPMLDRAARSGTARPVTWQQADAQALPFADGAFDVVACQFGVMFLPDRVRGHAEARRVLRPGGTLLFSVWDTIAANVLAGIVTDALAAQFPADPPRFLVRTPHGHADPGVIAAELAAAGFPEPPRIDVVAGRSVAPSAADAARAYCQGTPLAGEIAARGGDAEAATAACAAAIAARYGDGEVDAPMRALVVTVRA